MRFCSNNFVGMKPTYAHPYPTINMGYITTVKLKHINPEGSSTTKKLSFKSPSLGPNKKIKEKDCFKAALSSSAVSSPSSSASDIKIITSCLILLLVILIKPNLYLIIYSRRCWKFAFSSTSAAIFHFFNTNNLSLRRAWFRKFKIKSITRRKW